MLKQVFAGAIALATLILLFSGCQKDSDRPTRYTYREPSATDASALLNSDAQRLLRELEAFAERNPLDLEQIQSQVYDIEAIAPDSDAAEAAQRILKKVRTEYEAAAERRYRTAMDRAGELSDQERFNDAIVVLERFVREFSESSTSIEAQKERLKLMKAREAKSDFDLFVRNVDNYRAVDDYDGLAEYVKGARPDSIKDTSYEERLAEYLQKLGSEEESYRSRTLRENALPWETLPPAGEHTWRGHGGLWRTENGRIHGINRTDDYGRFIVGEGDWKDYVIDMQFTLRSGEFDLGLRGIMASNFSRTYKTIDVCFGLENRDQVVDMRVTMRDDMVTIESPSLPEPRYIKITERDGSLKHSYGPICLFLHRDSEVVITRLRVRHLAKVTEPTAEK